MDILQPKDILLKIGRFRYLSEMVWIYPSLILEDIRKLTSYEDYIYPCDVIELRTILSDNKIVKDDAIPLFSSKFAEKYLSRYPIFIVLNGLGTVGKQLPGVKIFDSVLNLDNTLKRIQINAPLLDTVKKDIYNIIKDTKQKVEVVISNNVPGISSVNPKLSQNKNMFKIAINTEVSLTEKEKQIFYFLLAIKKYFSLKTEIRCSGGWVRDKLMGLPSDDIDIALSDLTGSQLVDYIREYPNNHNVVGKSYQVAANVDKSKHLETAGIDLYDQKVEFVNLRSENYGKTRIPTMEMGSPKQDAERRDLTINALFYNIETKKIEDYVGGMEDLKNGFLRTPLDARATFRDDPLRILRALRFSSKFPTFLLSPDIIEAMKQPDIQQAYEQKVSTERAGPEIMKMMESDNPVPAIRTIFDTGLYKSVFKVPAMQDIHSDGIMMNQQTPWHKFDLKEHTLKTIENLNNIMKSKGETPYMRGLLNLASLFHDFGKMKKGLATPHPKNPQQMQYLGHEIASQQMADQILKSIGVGKEERDIVGLIINLHMRPLSAANWSNKGKANFLRKTILPGKEEESKNLWKYIFYHAQADEMSSDPDRYNEDVREKIFTDFENYVSTPPTPRKLLVNGNDVKTLYSQLPPGPWISQVLSILQGKQDEGVIKNRDEALQYLETMRSQILNNTLPAKEANKMANWYSALKQAQSITLQENITKGPQEQPSRFYVGMKVRDRRRGVVLPQEYGEVKNINNNIMKIIWFDKNNKKKKEEKFDILKDIIPLSVIVAEV